MKRTTTITTIANMSIKIPVVIVYDIMLRIPFRVLPLRREHRKFVCSEMEGTYDALRVFAPRRVYTTMVVASMSAATDAEYQTS